MTHYLLQQGDNCRKVKKIEEQGESTQGDLEILHQEGDSPRRSGHGMMNRTKGNDV